MTCVCNQVLQDSEVVIQVVACDADAEGEGASDDCFSLSGVVLCKALLECNRLTLLRSFLRSLDGEGPGCFPTKRPNARCNIKLAQRKRGSFGAFASWQVRRTLLPALVIALPI